VSHSKFPAQVLTPEGEVFSQEVEMVSTRTSLGVIAILARHEPLLAILEPTELRLYRSASEIVRFAQAEGYLQFADNQALLLVEEAIPPEQLDRASLETRLSEARASAERAGQGSEQRARALRDVRRYEAFLSVGG
jgi:F-type H+-transporting ATPase subunit epsilon